MEIKDLYALYRESGKVSTDTRNLAPGSLFFALKGDRFNANALAHEALEKGARLAIIDQDEYKKDERYVVVPDSLTVLQLLARYHRNQLNIPVLALTGSNGKTTSKELTHAVLSRKFKALATKGNLNNHIGVPLTLLSITDDVEIAVIEMGANHVGEIATLCKIANPTHGFITNIGKAHIGTFGGFENIIRAKTELYAHLKNHGGTAFINSTNPILAEEGKRMPHSLYYPQKNDFLHCTLVKADPYVVFRSENGQEIQTHLIGAYNFENIAAALCAGKFFGVPENEADAAIAGYVPANMRSQVIHKGPNTILLDAYNANPSSMAAAIETLSDMKSEKKAVILGDMFELEGEAEKEHRELGILVQSKKFDSVFLCGQWMHSAFKEVEGALYFPNKAALEAYLKSHPLTQATILVKGSRGMGLETLLDAL